MSLEPLETASGSDFPTCRQFSVFLENRLGQLLRLTRLFEGSDVRILGISVDGASDCAVIRLLVDEPDEAHEMMTHAGFALSESELLVVQLPHGRRGLMSVCIALIASEINIQYVYPLFSTDSSQNCMAIQVDNLSGAATSLAAKKFRLLDHSELKGIL